MILLEIPLLPCPWAAHKGYGRKAFNPRYKEREAYRWYISSQYKGKLITGAVWTRYEFYFPIPQSYSKKKRMAILEGGEKHVVRPDCTNLQKMLEDCIKGIVFKDDSQVYSLQTEKFWAGQNGSKEGEGKCVAKIENEI